MKEKGSREHDNGDGSDPPPEAIKYGPRRPRTLDQSLQSRLGVRRMFHYPPQTFFRPGKPAKPGELFYSKIHCFAAALNFSKPSSERASE